MGVYYYFKNERTGETNKKALFGEYFAIYWYAKFDTCDEEEQITIFKRLIEANEDWLETDVIIATPDSDALMYRYLESEVTVEATNID